MLIIKRNNFNEGVDTFGVVESKVEADKWIQRYVIDTMVRVNNEASQMGGQDAVVIATIINPEYNQQQLVKSMGVESFGEMVGMPWFVGADRNDFSSGELIWCERIVRL